MTETTGLRHRLYANLLISSAYLRRSGANLRQQRHMDGQHVPVRRPLYGCLSKYDGFKRTVERIPWHQLVPDFQGQLFCTTRALMPHASSRLIPAARTRDGTSILAYVTDRRLFTLLPEYGFSGEWVDPVSGRSFALVGKPGDVLQIPATTQTAQMTGFYTYT